MIFVECDPDALLVETLTNLARRDIIHDYRGKNELCNRLTHRKGVKGLVDEDPGKSQHRYIETLQVQEEFPDEGLRLLRDSSRNNLLIVLRPELEGWTPRSARLAKIDVTQYGLPDDARKPHRDINLKLDEFKRLITALDEQKSKGIATLRRVLETGK